MLLKGFDYFSFFTHTTYLRIQWIPKALTLLRKSASLSLRVMVLAVADTIYRLIRCVLAELSL